MAQVLPLNHDFVSLTSRIKGKVRQVAFAAPPTVEVDASVVFESLSDMGVPRNHDVSGATSRQREGPTLKVIERGAVRWLAQPMVDAVADTVYAAQSDPFCPTAKPNEILGKRTRTTDQPVVLMTVGQKQPLRTIVNEEFRWCSVEFSCNPIVVSVDVEVTTAL